MSVKIEFAELQTPLFLGGKNHQVKLQHGSGLALEYDREEKELLVTYNKKTAIIPSSNVASMTIGTLQAEQPVAAPRPGRPIKAQASSPTDHVFADGPGKTRD